ncbi:MAG TPA: hypothetical protein VJL54_01650 [Nitrososphaera sp.]|jgi:hypothetical protein|nr:hypothetical protein [Nitrososphaera sp.]
MPQLFGVFAFHSPESCPLNNTASREKFLEIGDKIKPTLSKHRISKLHGFYMSVLEHEWVIIVEAESAHDIEAFCIEVGISATSTVKIVPLNNFDVVIQKIRASAKK